MLLKFEIINKTPLKNKRDIYFSYDIEPDHALKLYHLSKKKCKQIFQYINQDDMGVLKMQIKKALKLHLHTIEKYLDILLEFKLIVKKKDRNKELYFIND